MSGALLSESTRLERQSIDNLSNMGGVFKFSNSTGTEFSLVINDESAICLSWEVRENGHGSHEKYRLNHYSVHIDPQSREVTEALCNVSVTGEYEDRTFEVKVNEQVVNNAIREVNIHSAQTDSSTSADWSGFRFE